MAQLLLRKKEDANQKVPDAPVFTPTPLPRHMQVRCSMKAKFSLKDKDTTFRTEVEKAGMVVEQLRRSTLLSWHREVCKLKDELKSMEKSLDESLVRQDANLREKIIKRRAKPMKLPELTEAEMEQIPYSMRPRPTKKPIEQKKIKKQKAEKNERSYQVLQIKLNDRITAEYSTLSGIRDHYRILLTPDPCPELKTVRRLAGIAAINAKSRVGRNAERKRSDKAMSRASLSESQASDPGTHNLDLTQHRKELIDKHQEVLRKNKEHNKKFENEDRFWGLAKQVKKTTLQVRMPEIIKRVSRASISVGRMVQFLHNESKALHRTQDDNTDQGPSQESDKGSSQGQDQGKKMKRRKSSMTSLASLASLQEDSGDFQGKLSMLNEDDLNDVTSSMTSAKGRCNSGPQTVTLERVRMIKTFAGDFSNLDPDVKQH